MFGLPRARLVVYGLALAIGLSLLLWPSRPTAPTAYDAQLRTIWHRKMAADAQALREARAAVVQRDGTVTRTIVRYNGVRYKTDTLPIHDTVKIREIVESADAVAKSCTELQSACAAYRIRAESVMADLRVDRDAWKVAASRSTPRLDARASALYDPFSQTPAASLDATLRVWRGISGVGRIEQRFSPGQRPVAYLGLAIRL